MHLKYLNSAFLGIRCQISSIKQALQGKANIYGKIFDLVVAYEWGHWSEVSRLSAPLQLQQEELFES
jgi:c-di-GMP-related signal transduction protein